jgi:hypothetical protein
VAPSPSEQGLITGARFSASRDSGVTVARNHDESLSADNALALPELVLDTLLALAIS